MATLKEAIYGILSADAQLTGVDGDGNTRMGTLLGQSGTAPYGVYFMAPPDQAALPYVTYYIPASTGRFPRTIMINFVAWGDNFEAILRRIYQLLHDAQTTSADFRAMMLKWDNGGAELWDDDLKCYYCTHTFICKAISND